MRVKASAVALACVLASVAYAGPDTITYQGSLLNHLGGPVSNGTYQMQFKIFDAATGGTNRWEETDNVQVTRALFSTILGDDTALGGLFLTYPDLWLEVTVDVDRSGTFEGDEVFSPRQNLAGVPWACPRLQPNAESPNLVGGHSGNYVTTGAHGATIGGGGDSGLPNRVTDDWGTVGGGFDNQAGDDDGTTSDAMGATVAGGVVNAASGILASVGGGWHNEATSFAATIGGGALNHAEGLCATVGGGEGNDATGIHATVGGGQYNNATSEAATVAGGYGNYCWADYATIGGGYIHYATSPYATVGGGMLNSATSECATIAGGRQNSAAGAFSAVAGGRQNAADGEYSFAAGRRANAHHNGSFVLTDSTDDGFSSVRDDALRVRFNGGATFVVNNDEWVRFWETAGHLIDTSANGAHLTVGGAWTDGSDRNAKENFATVDPQDVLARVTDLPITTWNYKAEEPSIRHMGPVGQDFYASFGLGQDGRHIAALDANGVALAAIQGLYQIVQEKETRISGQQQQIATLQAQVSAQQARNADLESRLAALEALVVPMTQGVALLAGGKAK